jgi:hypothetical protein
LEERIKEEEKAWLKEYELVQAAKARGEEQDKEVEEARKLNDQTVEAKNVYQRAQKDLNELLEQLFAGPTPSFPSEDEIEQSLITTRQKLDDINVLAKRQQYITNSLQRALQCLVGALQALQSSLQINTFDLFSAGGYADWMVNSALAQARDLAARAQFLVSEVRRIDPNVPYLGDISIEQDNLVFNIIFDNIFTDLRVRQIIQESLVKVERAAVVLQNQVLPEVVAKNKAAQVQIETCQKDVRGLEKAMWDERSRIMQSVIGERALSQSQPQPAIQPAAQEEEQTTYAPPERAPTYQPPLRSSTEASDIASDEPPPPYTLRETGRR